MSFFGRLAFRVGHEVDLDVFVYVDLGGNKFDESPFGFNSMRAPCSDYVCNRELYC